MTKLAELLNYQEGFNHDTFTKLLMSKILEKIKSFSKQNKTK